MKSPGQVAFEAYFGVGDRSPNCGVVSDVSRNICEKVGLAVIVMNNRESAIEKLDSMKPCPHCGRKPLLLDPEAFARGVGFSIDCEKCYLSMHAFASENPNKLIGRWNERK